MGAGASGVLSGAGDVSAGAFVGSAGEAVGASAGAFVDSAGEAVGASAGAFVGSAGEAVGASTGAFVGSAGEAVGASTGAFVGSAGEAMGASAGAFVDSAGEAVDVPVEPASGETIVTGSIARCSGSRPDCPSPLPQPPSNIAAVSPAMTRFFLILKTFLIIFQSLPILITLSILNPFLSSRPSLFPKTFIINIPW